MRRLFAFLVLAATLAAFVRAAEGRDCIAETWKGTIGTVPVMMEFDHEGEDGALAGRYYYRSSLVDLLLVRDGSKPERWKEVDPGGKVSGYLTLTCRDHLLSGTWTSPDGSKSLQVSAEAQPSDSFFSRRREGIKPAVTRRESVGGFHYELFTARGFDAVKGLRLSGDGKAIADINMALMEKFTDSLKEAVTCKSLGRLRMGEDNSYAVESEMWMVAWNRAFVVVGEKSSNYCGQTHPMYSEGATTYNLGTGKEEDVSQWLIDRYRADIPKDSPLGQVILEIYREEEGSCDEESIELSGASSWPDSDGITFRPAASYSDTACIQDITVPYEKMSPYLSPLGKKNAQAFQGH
ncbi:MAG: hypothetical protein LLF99_03555 [Desulfobacteraceae bacterium]|nr:hypothetical protein [Desulfobacteraceae bacterium]